MRYIVIEGSESAHCCFGYTVVDTQEKHTHYDKPRWVCECFDKEDADRIALTLNQMHERESGGKSGR